MAEQEKLHELDLSNKEDRKLLKRLIADKNKNRSYELMLGSYRNIKNGAKKYNFTVMSDGTFRYNNEIDRINLDNKNLHDAISNSNHPLFSSPILGPKDIESDINKYKVSVTYEEPKVKPVVNTGTKQGSKLSPKPTTGTKADVKAKPSTNTKANTNDKSSRITPHSKNQSNTSLTKTLTEKSSNSIVTGDRPYITLPEVIVNGTKEVTHTDRNYARAYRNQHLGESKGNSYKQTPLLTRLRNWWNSKEEPSVLETPATKLEYYFAPIPNALPVVPLHNKAYERLFRTLHLGEKGLTRRSYKEGGILKALQGTQLRLQNTQTPTLDAIMNNPLLAESFLLVLSQQLGKEISMEDLVTASQNPELAPQLEAIAQQVMKQSAALGAKLQYISRLRGKCPEGQELVYFAKGGKVCSACMGKKLEDGGKPKYMKDFEEKQKAKKGCKLKK